MSDINPDEMNPIIETRAVSDDAKEAEYRIMANGARADVVTGKIVAGPALDSAGARDLQQRRVAKTQAAVRRAIAAADTTHSLAQQSVYGGISTIAAAQVELALSPEQGRAATEAAKFLLRHGGLAAEDGSGASQPAVRLELSAGALEYIGELMRRRAQGD
jgi:hypothetical protein